MKYGHRGRRTPSAAFWAIESKEKKRYTDAITLFPNTHHDQSSFHSSARVSECCTARGPALYAACYVCSCTHYSGRGQWHTDLVHISTVHVLIMGSGSGWDWIEGSVKRCTKPQPCPQPYIAEPTSWIASQTKLRVNTGTLFITFARICALSAQSGSEAICCKTAFLCPTGVWYV